MTKLGRGWFVMRTVSPEEAVGMIPDGARLMVGEFMAVGTPERLIDEIVRQGKRNLTLIANDTGKRGLGVGKRRCQLRQPDDLQSHRPQPRDTTADDRRHDSRRSAWVVQWIW